MRTKNFNTVFVILLVIAFFAVVLGDPTKIGNNTEMAEATPPTETPAPPAQPPDGFLFMGQDFTYPYEEVNESQPGLQIVILGIGGVEMNIDKTAALHVFPDGNTETFLVGETFSVRLSSLDKNYVFQVFVGDDGLWVNFDPWNPPTPAPAGSSA